MYLKFLLPLLLIATLSSCVSNFVFVLTNKQVESRYANKPNKPTFKTIATPSGKVFYATQGDSTKPLLVFIHGAPGHWYSSIHLFDDTALLAHFYIITYDRPGYGKSNNGYSVPYIDAQTEVLQQIITKENFSKKKVIVVGRSYGTPIAARYAMLYPNQTKKLLLLAPCVDPKKEKLFWFSFGNKLGFVNAFVPDDMNTATEEKFRHSNQLKFMQNDWDKITAPTYIVQGRKDWIADTANAYFAEQKIVNAFTKMYLIDNTGHNVSRQHPKLIKDLILE
jgi:pimeloyl-ACP methyl ester carboxylesterase